ncbi:MAG: NUDIX hydrolase [Armatimonadetes bacterium]|nr:NUDIX hydrolase [Armatimonadota bacterium]
MTTPILPHSHLRDPGYRFCPRCGGPLQSRTVKSGEPDRLCCTACEFVFYLDPKLAAGVVATVENRLVLLRRGIEPAYGAWVFPGGFVDRGEHPEQAAIREAQEEAGVVVRLDGMLGIYSHPPGSHVVLVVYHGVVSEGRPRAMDESLEAGLFPPEEVPWPELAFATTRQAVADYVRRLGLEPPAGEAPTRPWGLFGA